jgi:hypothetical protein
MSTRYNNGSHYENHQRAAELHDQAAHSHRAAADHSGKEDHQTGQEQSARAREHSQQAYVRSQQVHREASDAIEFGYDETAALAYKLWHARGCPDGSPEQDWSAAVEQLRSHKS